VERCDAIIWTGFGGAVLGALAGVALASGALQLMLYAVLGVWAGALAGGVLGAVRCGLVAQRRKHLARARGDVRIEPAKKLRPAGL
jgi:hypothetical protein